MGPSVSNMDLEGEGILGEFEGEAVTEVGVEVRNAGGGLNESLKTDPFVKRKGDTVYVILRCDVVDVHFPNVKGNEGQSRRVHVLRATDVTIGEHAAVTKMIDQQRARNQARRDAEKQQLTLVPDERLEDD